MTFWFFVFKIVKPRSKLWQKSEKKLKNYKIDYQKCGGIFNLAEKEQSIQELESQMAEGSFWDHPEEAKKVLSSLKELRNWVLPFKDLQNRTRNLEALFPEAKALQDEEILQEISGEIDAVLAGIEELEIRKMLSNELDGKDTYLTINAGAGGTESCDWAEMLARMYTRWAERRGWKVEKVDFVSGEVTGFKSITFRFSGAFAYGYAKAEKGVHRLVRISPFDSNAKRHTSFASVDVAPVIEDDIEVELRSEDLRIDTFRASGAGGQHVNKTDSAVRITHIPTKITVSCQSERSQLQNKETCFKMLRSKLYELEVIEREEKFREIQGEKKEIAWGSQIRSYVFQPYTMVKDTRTKVEYANIQAVMDGDIDVFVNQYLKEFG